MLISRLRVNHRLVNKATCCGKMAVPREFHLSATQGLRNLIDQIYEKEEKLEAVSISNSCEISFIRGKQQTKKKAKGFIY